MKTMLFALIFSFSALASAATTTCTVVESTDGGENFDQVVASQAVAYDEKAVVLYQRETEAYLAIASETSTAIAQVTLGEAGNTVTHIVSGSGAETMFMNVAGNIAIGCSRK